MSTDGQVRSNFPVTPDDLPQAWRGAASWIRDGAGWQPWRVHPDLLRPVMSEMLEERARVPNGVRLAVDTDATGLIVDHTAGPDRTGIAEVLVDGQPVAELPVTAQPCNHEVALPGVPHRLEVWLPHSTPTILNAVELRSASAVAPAPTHDLSWTTYGSSITQCNSAERPTETWPALVARRQGWELNALGMAGQCHLDPTMAVACARTEPDLVSLCLGINVYGNGSFNARSLPAAVAGFVTSLRSLISPGVPIVAITPIVSPSRERQTNSAGLTLGQVRELVRASLQQLAEDDPHLRIIDGSDILDDRHAERLLGDGLHPNPEGYRHMAEQLAPMLAEAMANTPAATGHRRAAPLAIPAIG